jgi:Uma2 family endonuclease
MSIIETEAPVFLSPELAGSAMTPEEFDAIDDGEEGYRYELINGVLVVSPYPLEAERDPNEELGRWLRNYKEFHPNGTSLDKTLNEQTIRTRNRRRADRVIWAGLGRIPDPAKDVPTIGVEFVSAGKRNRRRDYFTKRDEYMEAGVSEYWIIDRFRRIMTVYHNEKGKIRDQIVQENEVYQTPLLPGFELPLAQLLALADSWGGS